MIHFKSTHHYLLACLDGVKILFYYNLNIINPIQTMLGRLLKLRVAFISFLNVGPIAYRTGQLAVRVQCVIKNRIFSFNFIWKIKHDYNGICVETSLDRLEIRWTIQVHVICAPPFPVMPRILSSTSHLTHASVFPPFQLARLELNIVTLL